MKTMGRTVIVRVLGVIFFGLCSSSDAQQPRKIPVIGFLSASSDIDPAFLDGLRQLGYVDKRTILIEHRSANGKLDRLPELARELVNSKVDLIVTQGTPAAQAAKKATTTVPIVMATTGDAIRTGLVASLAAPGGNITGLSFLAPDMATRRLEIFKEALSKITSVAMLINPAISTEMIGFKILQDDAPRLSVNVRMFEVRDLNGLDEALAAARREHFQAAILPPNSSYIPERQYIVSVAAKHRMPLMYGWRDFPEVGGLMSYGVSLSDLFVRAATYVDKILKGTRPADLPIEQPIKFELIINLNTAKQLELTISPNVLARADRVIK
jgi:putative ABC transport system substrate-binding protein